MGSGWTLQYYSSYKAGGFVLQLLSAPPAEGPSAWDQDLPYLPVLWEAPHTGTALSPLP